MINKPWQKRPITKIVLLLFLVSLILMGAVPGYLSGSWHWTAPPRVKNLKQLRAIRQEGLEIAGWQIIRHQELPISGHKWLFQVIEGQENQTVLLLLKIQNSHHDQPRVAWVDIDGFQRQLSSQWETDSHQIKQLVANSANKSARENVKFRARFLRGWNQQQTYAMLQWYAWPKGGDPSPARWFWADRMAQGKGDRAPWVAVSLLIPIEPLGDIEKTWPLAKSLAETVQASLMAGPLKIER